MKVMLPLILACGWMSMSVMPVGAQALEFPDLAGWWSAEPTHGGESSRLALQFVERDGKPLALLSIPAIGAYGIPLGDVAISGSSIDTRGLSFPLEWNPVERTLVGTIPAEAAPIYQIPVEFRRAGALEKPPPNEWPAPRPRIAWSLDTGGAPVWAGIERDPETGMLYVGNEDGVVTAIDRNGRIAWKFETAKPIRAQPRLIGREVYIHSDSGFVYKLAAKSGAQVWRARVDSGSEPRRPTNEAGTRWDRYGSSVVGNRTHIYVSSRDRNLYALDRETGREAWRVSAGDIMTATPALYRDLVIFAAYDGEVRAVRARDGTPRWRHDARLAVPGDLTVSGDTVLLGSRSYDLIALDASTGRESWKRYYWFSWIESPPVVHDGVVYTGSSDATHVYATRLADGTPHWKTAVPGFSWQRPAVNDELVIAGTVGAGEFPGPRAGSLVALERTTGAIRWIHLEPPAPDAENKAWGFGAAPVLTDGVVYAADLAGRLYAFETK